MEPEPTAAEYTEMPVRITPDAIYFGDFKVPGCIAEGGVTLRPGQRDDINRLTVEFLVGPVHVEDAFAQEVTMAGGTLIRYSSKAPSVAGLIQDVPETSTTERMHDLSGACWCEPTVDGEYLRHHRVAGAVPSLPEQSNG